MMLLRRMREILHFEITESIKKRSNFIYNGSLCLFIRANINHILGQISMHMRLMMMLLRRRRD